MIVAALLLALGPALPGCAPRQEAGTDGIHVQRPRQATPGDRSNLYKLQVYYITERVGLDEVPMDFWRFLDQVPSGRRGLLEHNGLRIGIGGEETLKRLDAMLKASPTVEVQRTPDAYVQQGYALDVPRGMTLQDFSLLYHKEDGTLCGRDFNAGSTILRFQCKASADEANTSDVYVSQWIIHGEKQSVWRMTPTGRTIGEDYPKFWFDDLETRVSLREGQVLAIGAVPGHDLSIGQQMFVKQDRPYKLVTTVILAPELVAAGSVPPGAVVGGPAPNLGAADAAPANAVP